MADAVGVMQVQDVKYGDNVQGSLSEPEWLAVLVEEVGEVAKEVVYRNVPPVDSTALEHDAAGAKLYLECLDVIASAAQLAVVLLRKAETHED